MDRTRLFWQVAGVVCVALGAFVLVHRGSRRQIARRMSDRHAPFLRRYPWLYGPKGLREWWFSEEGWRRFVVAMAVGIIMVGLMWLFVAGGTGS